VDIIFADHAGSDPKSVVRAAKDRNEQQDARAKKDLDDPFREVWVVFDTEGPQNAARQTAAQNAIEQARQLQFNTAVSNPSFEYWYLLHYEYTTKNLADGSAVIHKLKSHLPDYDKGKNYFSILREKTQDAIANSKKALKDHQPKNHPCDCHPSTEVIAELPIGGEKRDSEDASRSDNQLIGRIAAKAIGQASCFKDNFLRQLQQLKVGET
jgi:hypothetical protein